MNLAEEFGRKLTRRDVRLSALILSINFLVLLPLFHVTGRQPILGFTNLLIIIAAFLLPLRAVALIYVLCFIGAGAAYHLSSIPIPITTAIPGIVMSLMFGTFALFVVQYRSLERKLRQSLEEIRTLEGILPICASCKKIRDDQGYWKQIEQYISSRTDARFSHGVCPECAAKLYPNLFNSDGSRKKEMAH